MPKDAKNVSHPNLKARVLPHNDEAEQAILGCVMIDENAPVTILSELTPDDFYSGAHKLIFTAMQSLAQEDKPVDIVTLVQEVETMGCMEKVGGITYLTDLSNFVPSADNYKHYLAIVKKNSLLRRLIAVSGKIADNAFEGDPADNALELAESEIYALSEKRDRSTLVDIKEAVGQAVEEMEYKFARPKEEVNIPIKYRGLNYILNGFHRTDLVLIAARPGQGKTSIGMNLITDAALDTRRTTAAGAPDPYKCAVFSLEMSAVQLANRMLASVAKVDMGKMLKGNLQPDEWKKIAHARKKLSAAKIFIDDSSLTTPVEILSKCRRLKRELGGLDLVMVDYLQLMSSGKRSDNRQQEVADITRNMKIAAKELNVPILLLSQMSREVEKRNTKEPQMSDLRESGAIEQDADIIMFIYRPHKETDNVSDEEKSRVEIHIAKHRNGTTGKVPLRWRGSHVSFEDMDPSADADERAALSQTENGGRFIMGDDDVPPTEQDDLRVKMNIGSGTIEEILKVSDDDDII